MSRPSKPVQEPDSRPWLRLALVVILPILWLVAGICFLPVAS